jgi:hypothetical protein
MWVGGIAWYATLRSKLSLESKYEYRPAVLDYESKYGIAVLEYGLEYRAPGLESGLEYESKIRIFHLCLIVISLLKMLES